MFFFEKESESLEELAQVIEKRRDEDISISRVRSKKIEYSPVVPVQNAPNVPMPNFPQACTSKGCPLRTGEGNVYPKQTIFTDEVKDTTLLLNKKQNG